MLPWLRYTAKAVAAGASAAGAGITLALLDGKIDGGELTTIIVGTVVAVCAVFQTDNGDKPT